MEGNDVTKCNTLNVVLNSNGVVRIYSDGGLIFEIQSDYVKTEVSMECNPSSESGVISKSKKDNV